MPKRANGEGNIYKRKDGRWEARAYLRTTNHGKKRVSVFGKTRAEASEKLTARIVDNSRGNLVSRESWTIGSYLDYWITDIVPRNCRPKTVEGYESIIRVHLKPILGKLSFNRMTPMVLQRAFDAKAAEGCTPRILNEMRKVLSAALTRARRQGHISTNPARDIEVPTYRAKPKTPWTADEVRQFLHASQTHPWYVAYLIMLAYGLRRGEVLGLRWCDVNLARGTLTVSQQLQRLGSELVLGPVKTDASNRVQPLIPDVREALLQLAFKQGIDLPLDRACTDERLINVSTVGTAIDPKNFVRAFKRLAVTAGVPPITVHTGRHTTATLLKDTGAPQRDAQDILGHSDAAITQQIYQHSSLESRAKSLSRLNLVPRSVNSGGRWRQPLASNTKQSLSASMATPVEDADSGLGWMPPPPPLKQGVLSSSLRWPSKKDLPLNRGERPLLDNGNLFAELSNNTIQALHIRTNRRILGHVGVKNGRQTLPPGTAMSARLSELVSQRHMLHHRIIERKQRRSFPLNLIPDSTRPDHEEVA